MNQNDKLRDGVRHYLSCEQELAEAQKVLATKDQENIDAWNELARLVKGCGRDVVFGDTRFYIQDDDLLREVFDAIVLDVEAEPQ